MLSRAVGLSIILSLLPAFLIASALGKHLDAPIALAFLTIASGLIGISSGFQIVKRNDRKH